MDSSRGSSSNSRKSTGTSRVLTDEELQGGGANELGEGLWTPRMQMIMAPKLQCPVSPPAGLFGIEEPGVDYFDNITTS
jgi:hypothetical protein